MSRKFVLAVVAVAALGAAALVPTAASARGGGGGFGGGHGGGFGGGHGMSFHGGGHSIGHHGGHSIGHRPQAHRPVSHRPSHLGRVNHPNHIGHHRPHPRPIHAHHHHHHHKIGWWWKKNWCHHHHHHHHWCRIWFPGIEFGVDGTVEATAPVTVAPVATTPVSTPAPVAKDTCTCLTKTYLPDGSVLFKDVCTKEMAMATAEELKAQAEGTPPAK
jgi:hypothetical protein